MQGGWEQGEPEFSQVMAVEGKVDLSEMGKRKENQVDLKMLRMRD